MQWNTPTKRRSLIAAGVGALITGAAVWAIRGQRQAGQGPVQVKAARHPGDLPLADPEDKAWLAAPAATLKLIPQQMFFPKLAQATIAEAAVRALFNGKQLGFRLEWGDASADDVESITRFRDAAACMLPLNPTAERPPVFMGMAGKPVYILQWKSSWQKDLEQGFQDVERAYPRWFNDVYPGNETLAKLGMKPEDALIFYPGRAVGNPLSSQKRASAVEELVAEGYGTLTSLPQQRAQGRGVFKDGRWRVSLGLPAADQDVPALQPGQTVPAAFAFWDGGKRQVGGRKHYADWVEVILPGS